jgi:hypothetical protein
MSSIFTDKTKQAAIISRLVVACSQRWAYYACLEALLCRCTLDADWLCTAADASNVQPNLRNMLLFPAVLSYGVQIIY